MRGSACWPRKRDSRPFGRPTGYPEPGRGRRSPVFLGSIEKFLYQGAIEPLEGKQMPKFAGFRKLLAGIWIWFHLRQKSFLHMVDHMLVHWVDPGLPSIGRATSFPLSIGRPGCRYLRDVPCGVVFPRASLFPKHLARLDRRQALHRLFRSAIRVARRDACRNQFARVVIGESLPSRL